MTAVILAAGLGSRLVNLFPDKPKGFLQIGNTSLIHRSIDIIHSQGIKKILIVTGHLSKYYEELNYKNITFCHNPIYKSTGSFYSLLMAAKYINGDIILLESDLLYEEKALSLLLNCQNENIILGSGFTNSGDEVWIEIDNKKQLLRLSKNKKTITEPYAELVGISKISLQTIQELVQWSEHNKNKALTYHYEEAFVEIIGKKQYYIKKINDLLWAEIDNEFHYKRATEVIYPNILK